MIDIDDRPWQFLSVQIPLLLKRYSLSFYQDDTCIEYYLDNRSTHEQISRQLTLSHETFTGNLYVSKFYPEIYREINCRYLSAACFYIIVHHAAHKFGLANHCRVNLETEVPVFENFYSRLDDFNFKIFYRRPGERVYLRGVYQRYPLETGSVHQKQFESAMAELWYE